MLRGLDLFSGIGGISLALKPWVRTVAYCECEPYAQAVLLERMHAGDLDSAPIWDDVRTLSREIFDAEIDIISGGFPCQDLSVAGHGKGLEGERSGLFFQIARLAAEYRPRFVFLENVPAICTRGGVEVIETITALGYDARWGVLSAYDVGAPHLRERWWCLAHAMRSKLRVEQGRGVRPIGQGTTEPRNHGTSEPMAVANRNGELQPSRGKPEQRKRFSDRSPSGDFDGTRLEIGKPCENGDEQPSPFRADWWEFEPDVGRLAHGVPYRVERIKALGNSVVPKTAREAFKRLMGIL